MIEKDDYDSEEYNKKDNAFGGIVFESNIDKSCKEIYEAYLERWNIELMFKMYKHSLEIKSIGSHNNHRLYANNFVSYLAMIMCSKVVKKLEGLELDKKYQYNQIMNYLSSYQKINEWVSNIKFKYFDELISKLEI